MMKKISEKTVLFCVGIILSALLLYLFVRNFGFEGFFQNLFRLEMLIFITGAIGLRLILPTAVATCDRSILPAPFSFSDSAFQKKPT